MTQQNIFSAPCGFSGESIPVVLSCVKHLGLALMAEDAGTAEYHFGFACGTYTSLPVEGFEFKALSELYGAARAQHAGKREADGGSSTFTERLRQAMPGAILASAPDRFVPANIHPDFWLAMDGEVWPVMVREESFGEEDIGLLLTCMRDFDCRHGVAVAPCLTIKPPSNIRFVRTR